MINPDDGSFILADNLQAALYLAIINREKHERNVLHYTRDSAALAAWKSNLEYLRAHGRIEVRRS